MIRGKGVIAGVLFPLILVAAVYALLISPHGITGTRVQAEFQDAQLLVPGDDVRIDGANVGSVVTMRLTDRGTALVTMNVQRGIAVHADATASVREADLLGDVYLALGPGSSQAPLRGPIPPSRTFVATDVQDVFDTFNAPTRSALQTLIVELGTALDARGIDLNRAVEQLAPAVGAVDRISSQLGSQNAQLQHLIDSAQGLTAQLAPRSHDIGALITGLDRTVQITSARTRSLAAGLQQLPDTLDAARTTLARLTGTADAATPLAQRLGAVAQPLRTAVQTITPFVDAARPALDRAQPLLTLSASTLGGAKEYLPLLGDAVGRLHVITPPLANLATLIAPAIAKGIEGVFAGLGGLAADPGPGGRNFFRGELVLGCETFGVATQPGCLQEALRQAAGLPAGVLSGTVGSLRTHAPAGAQTTAPPALAPRAAVPPASSAGSAPVQPPPAATSGPGAVVSTLLKPVTSAVHGPVGKLLDYLLGP